jgi:diacylglycerol kinase family enzyme/membrane-associated phospholipid phosphatase
VANALAAIEPATRPVMAIVPLGTANVLARELEVPIDTVRAMALAVGQANVVALDAIQVGERYYLTQLGAGLDARMIEGTSREDQQSSGRMAYFYSFVREMTGYRSHPFELTIDGRRHRMRAWQVVVANAKTMGTPPFTWGPEIEPTDGVLDVGVYDVRSVLDWARLMVRFLAVRHRSDRRAKYFQVRRTLRIATRTPMPVQADGDVIGDTPIDLTIAPALLRIVSGPDATEAAAPPVTAATVATDAAQAVRLTLWKRLSAVDHAAYRWVNRLPAGPTRARFARFASRTMDHGELWVLAAVLVAALDPAHDWRSMLVVVAVMWLVELTVNFPIKAAFRRTRPFRALTDADVRVARLPRDWSFPSGHSATAFAGAFLLSVALPILSPLLFAWAALVAFTRVYLGVHYPVDVVLGAAVGVGLAMLYGSLGLAILGMR